MLVEDLVNLKLDNGRYLIKSKLGEGGMGTVYLGHDTRLDSSVVVKVPHQSMLADLGFRDRFQREIQSLVRLMHPHIVKVIDVGEYEKLPFAVMQHLAGGSLTDLSQRCDDTISQLGDWLMPIAKALDFIHKKKYIHRDVKPANILFDDAGNAFLGDFGIAKVAEASDNKARQKPLTQPGIAMGTPEYMAPELCDGRSIDEKVDQYALGVTVFEFLSGQCPLVGSTPLATILMHKTHVPDPLHIVNPGISKEVGEVVGKAMAKSPEDRFESCVEFAKALLRLDIVRQLPDITSPGTGTFSNSYDETTMRDTSGLLVEIDDEETKTADGNVDHSFDPSLLVEVVDDSEDSPEAINPAAKSGPIDSVADPKHDFGEQASGTELHTKFNAADLLEEVDPFEEQDKEATSGNSARSVGAGSSQELPVVPPPIHSENPSRGKKRNSSGVPSNSLVASKRSAQPPNSPTQTRRDPCPACGKSLVVPASMVGKNVACPYCHKRLQVKNFGLKEVSN